MTPLDVVRVPLGLFGCVVDKLLAAPEVRCALAAFADAASPQVSVADGSAESSPSPTPRGAAIAPRPAPPPLPVVGHPNISAAVWLEPAVLTDLTAHTPDRMPTGEIYCYDEASNPDDESSVAHGPYADWQEWREHVAPLITKRVVGNLTALTK